MEVEPCVGLLAEGLRTPAGPADGFRTVLGDTLPAAPAKGLRNVLGDTLPAAPAKGLRNGFGDTLPAAPADGLRNVLGDTLPVGPADGFPNVLGEAPDGFRGPVTGACGWDGLRAGTLPPCCCVRTVLGEAARASVPFTAGLMNFPGGMTAPVGRRSFTTRPADLFAGILA